MITEDYVSFETAKLLKEKGFKIPYDSFRGVYINGIFKRLNPGDGYAHNFRDEIVDVCSLQMAMKWLREVYNIFIAINMIPDTIQKHYFFKLYLGGKIYNFPLEYSVEFYIIYEEAAEAGIKYCLEKLI